MGIINKIKTRKQRSGIWKTIRHQAQMTSYKTIHHLASAYISGFIPHQVPSQTLFHLYGTA